MTKYYLRQVFAAVGIIDSSQKGNQRVVLFTAADSRCRQQRIADGIARSHVPVKKGIGDETIIVYVECFRGTVLVAVAGNTGKGMIVADISGIIDGEFKSSVLGQQIAFCRIATTLVGLPRRTRIL